MQVSVVGEQEEEEGEQQEEGHCDLDQDVQGPWDTLGWSDVMNEPKVPFNEHLLCEAQAGVCPSSALTSQPSCTRDG